MSREATLARHSLPLASQLLSRSPDPLSLPHSPAISAESISVLPCTRFITGPLASSLHQCTGRASLHSMASAIFALNQIREIEGSREERKRARDREREVFWMKRTHESLKLQTRVALIADLTLVLLRLSSTALVARSRDRGAGEEWQARVGGNL